MREAGTHVMSPEQSRAARGWLGWSQAELARRANVSSRTVQAFEKGETAPLANNIAAIRRVIEEAGIRLVYDRTGMPAGIARFDADIGLPGESSM
jgi:DNA-binding XRE family transcriptional regulator